MNPTVSDEYYYDKKEALRIERFFSLVLRHPRGKLVKEPFAPMPWVKDNWLHPLFGWRRKSDGLRRFRRGLVYVPKKNGKSMNMAAIALYMLTSDNEQGAKVYAVATDEEQTDNVIGAAMGMVRNSPLLKNRLKILRSTNMIRDPETDSVFQGISADAMSAEGLDASCLILDEIHVWRRRDLWDALLYAGTARRQPLQISITTAGVWDPDAVWCDELRYARGVLDGSIIDPTYFALIYEAVATDDLLSPETWRRANPALGHVFSEEQFFQDLEKARRTPANWTSFLRYRLNMPALGVNAEFDLDAWDNCSRDFCEDDLLGRTCYAGVDLAATSDLTALVLVFPPDGNDTVYRVLPYTFLPEQTVEKNARKGDMRYHGWANDGYLEVTPGNVFDDARMIEKIKELSGKFTIESVAYDPWNANHMANALHSEGFLIEKFKQNIGSYAGVMNHFDKLYRSQGIAHNGNPALRWCVANVVADTDRNGNKCPNKKRSGEKIDLAIALLMGLDRAISSESRDSIYNQRGPITVSL